MHWPLFWNTPDILNRHSKQLRSKECREWISCNMASCWVLLSSHHTKLYLLGSVVLYPLWEVHLWMIRCCSYYSDRQ
jgi:hypothetical protein